MIFGISYIGILHSCYRHGFYVATQEHPKVRRHPSPKATQVLSEGLGLYHSEGLGLSHYSESRGQRMDVVICNPLRLDL